MKYILFGTGEYYQRYKKWFDREEVICLADNSAEKQHTMMDGIAVCSPEEAVGSTYDYIVILSFYAKEMRQQLKGLGVAEEKILVFFDLYKLMQDKKFETSYFGATKEEVEKNKKESVLLLGTDLELQGGPANVLLRCARILKKNGSNPVVGSMQDGPMKAELLEVGVPVVIDPNLQVKQMVDVEWTHGFRKVICNTIGYNVFVSKRDTSTPVVWWLHDSAFFYDGVDRELIRNMDLSGLEVCSVGKVPMQAIQQIIPELHVRELLYGIEEERKVVFIVLGYIEKRKGQDVLVEAVRLLEEPVRKKTKFYLVGNDSSELAKEIKVQINSMPELSITGQLFGDEKNAFMNFADVLICPSREDPMPIAVVEAMMLGKMTIVSNAAGIADFIENGVDGMIFDNENSHMLADKISFCVENIEKVKKMGRKSRKIYEKHFSMDAFEKCITEII